ncbi:hypothetical protein [Pseudomonas sp. 18175]|uniref:hypothetical protein n=1 Tax=Pseudomonas sp. 18175 TaxID=3390056 RepID=UPI003D1F6613
MEKIYIMRAAWILFCCLFSSAPSFGATSLPILAIQDGTPIKLAVFERGVFLSLAVPDAFMREVEGLYEEVYLKDLTGDGIAEFVFRLGGEGVNSCSRVLRYYREGRSLSELEFGRGGLCNFKVARNYIVSSYRDGASWNEDVYEIKDGAVRIKLSDRCIGCGEVNRLEYHPGGLLKRSLVSDDGDFEKRAVLTANVISNKANIYSSPAGTHSTQKYLMQGDKVTLLGFHISNNERWMEFRFEGAVVTEGWLRCGDTDRAIECLKLR